MIQTASIAEIKHATTVIQMNEHSKLLTKCWSWCSCGARGGLGASSSSGNTLSIEKPQLWVPGSCQCPWHQCCFRVTWFWLPSHLLALAGWRPPSVLHSQITWTRCHMIHLPWPKNRCAASCSNVWETCPLRPLVKWQARTSLLSSSSFRQSALVKQSGARDQRISFAY